jgi:hypothetical protein
MYTNASNTSASISGFGTYLGNTFKGVPNVLWQGGNDYSCYQTASMDLAVSNIHNAIISAGDTHPQTMEIGNQGQTSYDDVAANPTHNWATILKMNGAYTYYNIVQQEIPNDNAGIPYTYNQVAIPAIEVKGIYDGDNNGVNGTTGICGLPAFTLPVTPAACENQTVRKQNWGIFTAGGVGVIFGQHCIWQFASGADTTCAGGTGTGWPNYLTTAPAAQLINMKNFLSHYAWETLVPDSSHTFMTAGYNQGTCTVGTTQDQCNLATAAKTADGTLAIVYIPAAQNSITLNLGGMATGNVEATFYDPSTNLSTGSNGTTNPCPSSAPCSNTNGVTNSRVFGNTALNSEGDSTWSHDWVLVLNTGAPV